MEKSLSNEELLKQHQNLINKIASKYCSPTDPLFDDLTQVGSMGFLDCLKTYDPEKKVALSTYAYRHIQWNICVYLRIENKAPKPMEQAFTSNYKNKDNASLSGPEKPNFSLLEGLEQPYRDILIYKFWFNHNLKTIAKLLNINKHHIYENYHTAIDKLKTCLKEN